MSCALPVRKSLWVLPIVFVICAVMVLPGTAILAPSATASHVGSGLSAAASSTSGGSGLSPTPSSWASNLPTPRNAPTPSAPTASSASSFSTESSSLGSLASELASHPATQAEAGQYAALSKDVASGAVPPSAVYPPNAQLLTNPLPPGQNVNPGYVTQPAPFGVSDFGLSNSGAYAYNSSSFVGSITVNGANATFPGPDYFVVAGAPEYYSTPYTFGVQLNTVVTNISVPGSTDGVYWTQNVFSVNQNSLTFEDNVWNFSSSGAAMQYNTLYAGNGTLVPDDFYYDYGPTIPLSYPYTVNVYLNTSIVDNRDVVYFGYEVDTPNQIYQGIYDTVVFNNPNAATPPTQTPAFEVSGLYPNPAGLLYDSEFVLGGPGGGSNAVFSELNATMTLRYQDGSGYATTPSAWDFGGDTGETATGVSSWWDASTDTVNLNAGPELLYGLWNTPMWLSAAPGHITVVGQPLEGPDYQFIFVSNEPGSNLSLAPQAANGAFTFYLPPVDAGTAIPEVYFIYGFAPGFTPESGAFDASGGFDTSLFATTDQIDSPIYLNGNAQAAEAAYNLTGSDSAPLEFSGLNLSLGYPFTVLNDWGFPTFEMFQAQGVTIPTILDGVYEGPSTGENTIYTLDFSTTSTSILEGAPLTSTNDLVGYNSLINVFSSPNFSVENEVFYGFESGTYYGAGPQYSLGINGGGAFYWASSNGYAYQDAAWYGSFGLYVASSSDLFSNYTLGGSDANGVSIAASAGTTVLNAEGGIGGWAIYDVLGSNGVFENLFAGFDGAAFVGAGVNGSYFNNTEVTNDGTGVVFDSPYDLIGSALTDSWHNVIANTSSGDNSWGIELEYTNDTMVSVLTSEYNEEEGYALLIYDADQTAVSGLYAFDDYVVASVEFATNTSLVDSFIEDVDYAVVETGFIAFTTWTNLTVLNTDYVFADVGDWFTTTFTNVLFNAIEYGFDGSSDLQNTTLTNVTVADAYSFAYYPEEWDNTTFDQLYLTQDSYGFYGGYDFYDTSFTGLSVYDLDYGVYIYDSDWTSFATSSILDTNYGVDLESVGNSSFSDLTVNESDDGAYVDGGYATTVDGVTVTSSDIGVEVLDSDLGTARTISAAGDSLGLDVDGGTPWTISDVTSTGAGSLGVEVQDSSHDSVTGVSASDESTGVALFSVSDVTVSDVTATGASTGVLIDPSTDVSVTDVTVSDLSDGIYAIDADDLVISGVTATNSTTSSPWWYDDSPTAAIVLEDTYATTITGVSATHYPAALFDFDSAYLSVTNLNASQGYGGIYLNGTYDGSLIDVGLYQNLLGLSLEETEDMVVTLSSFVDNVGYGLWSMCGDDNTIYNNNFIGNNGATATYNPAHIQAITTTGDDYFYLDGVGNYWADWHTYTQYGSLAPYYVGGGDFDYYPLGSPVGTSAVTFYAEGISPGASWSVTFDGQTQTTIGSQIVFAVAPGSYSFTVAAPTGYTVTPASGSIAVTAGPASLDLLFAQQYTVTFTATGLATGASWSVSMAGSTQTATTSTITFTESAGTYAYTIGAAAGYSATPASGSVTVVAASYSVTVAFTQSVYQLTVSAGGLAAGTVWSATVNGVTQSTSGTSLTFYLANGTYTYSFAAVSGYTLTGGSGSVTVSGTPSSVGATYSSTSTTPAATSSNLNTYFAIAIALAVIALVVALIAFLLGGNKRPPSSGGSSSPEGATGPMGSTTPPPPASGSPPS